ncbi:MAG: recombinase [Bacteroidales bacterium]|mgnify:CR=1 FL=1|nr:recombinase [Bacteroidales bacterium]
MGTLLESLKRYFENTPKDILENDWKENEYLDNIGPDVTEYVNYVQEYFRVNVNYEDNLNYNITADIKITEDSQYYFAA